MAKDKNNEHIDTKRLKAALELYDNAPCGSVSFTNDGLIFDINQTLSTWLGYSKEELILKRHLPSLFRIGGQIFFETHFFPLIKMQGFIKEVYFDIVRKDNTNFHGLINVREIPQHDDNPVSYQATILDISDRRHYEEELLIAKKRAEADSKAKAEFLATISHEIRTPLNAILGIGNLLHETSLNKNQKEYARLLLHSSEHLLGLVNNLLDLSKIEANKIVLERVPFDLFDLSHVLKHTFLVKAKEKGIGLHMDIGDDVPRIFKGDPLKLKQILTNLIGNAIKFTKDGAVTLSIEAIQQKSSKVCIQFTVADTGIGIPKEKLESIFQEFSQASYDVSVEFGGTGLGLTISKKLLELHKSSLLVTSKLNKGSKFSFKIWYETSNEMIPKVKSISEKEKHKLEEMQVLIVDDNPDNIFIAEQYLDQWNIKYKSAKSGEQALSILNKKCFDLILLDLQMPKMNGYETAIEIRNLKLKKNPVIVCFSASTRGEVDKQLKEAGIDDYLSKPFQPKELFEILSRSFLGSKKTKIAVPIKKLASSEPTEKDISKSDEIAIESFNLLRYEKMANNKIEYLNKFKASTLDAMISYRKDFNSAIKNKKIKKLSDLIHKSTMSLYYIQADPLSDLLKECKEMLELEPEDKLKLTHKVNECNTEFEIIIKGLQVKY
ncbi:ATP-binding protein [Rasiella sp. SM2506]|uniref:ATP-binding protein n=1 Tax=Rasiella sp. SM2506 TaxID=3423914 RepID=UPI003D790C73